MLLRGRATAKREGTGPPSAKTRTPFADEYGAGSTHPRRTPNPARDDDQLAGHVAGKPEGVRADGLEHDLLDRTAVPTASPA